MVVSSFFNRTPAQEADLQQLLAQQTDPSSPLYHHWLTPEGFATRFGVADADITATESWLQSHGFIIDSLSRSHDRVTFSGTASLAAYQSVLRSVTYFNSSTFPTGGQVTNTDGTVQYSRTVQFAVNDGDPIYWDENSGPSEASENTVG